jgi:hypothetical protein
MYHFEIKIIFANTLNGLKDGRSLSTIMSKRIDSPLSPQAQEVYITSSISVIHPVTTDESPWEHRKLCLHEKMVTPKQRLADNQMHF